MTKTINATIVADSISPTNDRITSFVLTYPRFIHGEIMTHRVFSRNSASSRAIPFDKMSKMVLDDPFIPIAFQLDHKGMQGNSYIQQTDELIDKWIEARDQALDHATQLNKLGVTKQICNRILEPFMWHTVLVTSTEWNNFFDLRCPQYTDNNGNIFKSKKDYCKFHNIDINSNINWLSINKSQAEIHIQELAELIYDNLDESKPNVLQPNEWHIPFGDNIQMSILDQHDLALKFPSLSSLIDLKLRIATARCARLSYMTFENKIDYEKDIVLHDQLLKHHHMSPFEHCAKTMTPNQYTSYTKNNDDIGWCNNFKGFIQYRYLIE